MAMSDEQRAVLAEQLRLYGDEEHPQHRSWRLSQPTHGNGIVGNLAGMLQNMLLNIIEGRT